MPVVCTFMARIYVKVIRSAMKSWRHLVLLAFGIEGAHFKAGSWACRRRTQPVTHPYTQSAMSSPEL